MAKKDSSTALSGARVMRETIPNGHFALAEGEESAGSTGWDQYEEYESPGYYTKVFFGYFDLSGYTREQKTTFIRNVMFQNIGNPGLSGMQSDVFVREARIVSTTPMSMNDFTGTSHSTWILPGAPTSTFNSEEIVLGTQATYAMDVSAVLGRITATSSWGVGDSTAAEKLYYARAFRFARAPSSGAGTTIYFCTFPPVQVVIPILVGSEPDLEYMMRLKRSLDPVG